MKVRRDFVVGESKGVFCMFWDSVNDYVSTVESSVESKFTAKNHLGVRWSFKTVLKF
jgi:hypothetical protein